MIKRIRAWRKKKQEKKRERIAALIACILMDKTFKLDSSDQFRWLAKDIESEYVDAIFLIMKGEWEKALKLVGQIKYTPPDPINCLCTMIATEDSPPEMELVEVDVVKDPDNIIGHFLIEKYK